MVLAMTRPWKHPKTGVYYFRKGVPERLRDAVGMREIKRSLHTRDVTEARQRFRTVAVEVERLLSEAEAQPLRPRPEPRTLSQRQAHALAGEVYREIIAEHAENPGTPDRWRTALNAMQHTLPVHKREPGAPLPRKMFGFGPQAMAVRQLGPEMDAFLERRGIVLAEDSRRLFIGAAALAIAEARMDLKNMAEGDYSPSATAGRFPPVEQALPAEKREYLVQPLLDRWQIMSKPAPKTFKRWSGVLHAMCDFLQKQNVFDITEEDIQRWCDHRVGAGIAPSTISGADLAGPRTIFNWACGDKQVNMPFNPAKNVRIKVGKKVNLRPKGYKLNEALTILTATLQPMSPRLSDTTKSARRWVPWLCSYSGARVGEIAQLRAADISMNTEIEGVAIWQMHITPEAGTQKMQQARDVPIHSHLLDQGFLNYVKTRKGKPLFYDPERSRGGSEANRQSDKVGERLAAWIRELGVKDTSIAPNHAWRHRFRTIGRSLRIQDSMLNALDGHVAASIADTYGDYELLAMKWCIERYPRYKVSEDPSGNNGNFVLDKTIGQLHPGLGELIALNEE